MWNCTHSHTHKRIRAYTPGLPGPKKLKSPNSAIGSFKSEALKIKNGKFSLKISWNT